MSNQPRPSSAHPANHSLCPASHVHGDPKLVPEVTGNVLRLVPGDLVFAPHVSSISRDFFHKNSFDSSYFFLLLFETMHI